MWLQPYPPGSPRLRCFSVFNIYYLCCCAPGFGRVCRLRVGALNDFFVRDAFAFYLSITALNLGNWDYQLDYNENGGLSYIVERR